MSVLGPLKTDISCSSGHHVDLRDGPGTTSNGLAASFTVPDTNRVSLDCVLAAECADVSGVLCDFHLFHLLSERGTVSVHEVLVYRCIEFGERLAMLWPYCLNRNRCSRIPCAIFTGHANLCEFCQQLFEVIQDMRDDILFVRFVILAV